MEIKIKKLSDKGIIPTYAKHGDAGMDLTATSKSYDEHGNVVYGTSLAFEIPEGFVGLLFPRSSITKKDLTLGNSVGVLDSGYRGEVMFKFKPLAYKGENEDGKYELSIDHVVDYGVGDRIGQIIIIPHPKVTFVEVDELSSTERGDGGFGSSGV